MKWLTKIKKKLYKLETISWIGSISGALCGIPQALQSIQDGHSNGVTWGLLLLWLNAEICFTVYVLLKHKKNELALLFNYAFNILAILVIAFYKL